MTKKVDEKFTKLFVEAFREVVLPSFELIQEQIDNILQRMDTELATKHDISRLERRLIARENQLDRLGNCTDNHEKRIEKLETKIKLSN